MGKMVLGAVGRLIGRVACLLGFHAFIRHSDMQTPNGYVMMKVCKRCNEFRVGGVSDWRPENADERRRK